MGLAAYGEPHRSQDDLLPKLNAFSHKYLRDYSKQVRRSPSPNLQINLRQFSKKDEIYSPYFSRLAYNLQLECEQTMLHLARECLVNPVRKIYVWLVVLH